MKKLSVLLLATLAVFPLSASAAKKKASIKIINQSKWEIHHLFLSPSSHKKWGPDQLGENILKKGQSFTLTDIDCDDYDIRVVDEDGDECVIEEQSLCNDDSYWKITDKALLDCENEDDDD